MSLLDLPIDPLDGTPGTTTQTNPYPYADNNPAMLIDSEGKRPCDTSLRCLVHDAAPIYTACNKGLSPVGPFPGAYSSPSAIAAVYYDCAVYEIPSDFLRTGLTFASASEFPLPRELGVVAVQEASASLSPPDWTFPTTWASLFDLANTISILKYEAVESLQYQPEAALVMEPDIVPGRSYYFALERQPGTTVVFTRKHSIDPYCQRRKHADLSGLPVPNDINETGWRSCNSIDWD